jgi:hypothetical protein
MLTVLGSLALSGCVTADRNAGPDPSERPVAFHYVAMAAQKPAVALPLAAGRALEIREQTSHHGLRQEIHLSSDLSGIANTVTLLTGADSNPTLDAALAIKPTQAAIHAELALQFPGIAMDVETKPLANAYGRYGLAAGRSGTASCVYAWQWIDDVSVSTKVGVEGPVALRVKLCRRSLDAAVATSWLDKMTLGSDVKIERGIGATRNSLDSRYQATTPPEHDERAPSKKNAAALDSEAPPAPTTGPRYLAPLSADVATMRTPAADIGSRSRLAVDLPPQATLGPQAGPGNTPMSTPPTLGSGF